jgi:hypothetical protein
MFQRPRNEVFGPLLAAFRENLAGRDPVPPDVPPHLHDRKWRFVCECGLTWHWRGSAVVTAGKVTAPRRACEVCRTNVAGRLEQ